jgi:hypothetical protein
MTGSIFVFLWIFIVLLFNQTTINGYVNVPKTIVPQYLADSFFTSNTSEQEILFPFYFMGLGAKYNITIDLHSDSSSDVSFFIFSDSGKYIEGVKVFTLASNETRTETYTSHWESDGIPLRKSYFQLVDGTKNASGNYQVEQVHHGYDINVGTGETYIANITEWLISVSLTKTTIQTTSLSTSLSNIEWITGAITTILFIRRKKLVI